MRDLVEEFEKLDKATRNLKIAEVAEQEMQAQKKLADLKKQLQSAESQAPELPSLGVNEFQGISGAMSWASDTADLRQEMEDTAGEVDRLISLREKLENIDSRKSSNEDSESAATSKAAKKAEERLKKMLQSYQDETDMLDAELQFQEQVRAGYMSEEEGQIYSNFYRKEQQAKAHYKSLKDEIATHYKDEIDAAAGNADRIIELEQQKKTRLEELEQIHNENMRLMGEDQRLQLEGTKKTDNSTYTKLQERFATEEEALRLHAQNEMAIIAEAMEQKKITEEQGLELILAARRKHLADVQRLELTKANVIMSSGAQIFGALSDITSTFTGEQSKAFKAIFAVSKGFAVAQGVMNLSTAISNASALPWPTNFAAMAQAAAQGAQLVSTIRSVNYMGQAHDGIARMPAANEGTYLVRRDEMVLNPKQRENFDAMRQSFEEGKGGGKKVILNSSPTINVDARGSTMSETQVEAKVRMALDEYDSMLINDFAGNGERSQLLRVG